jgi:acyl carrier protein
MTTPEVHDVLGVIQQHLAATLALRAEDITATTRFSEDLKIDSLAVVELLMELEDRYGVIVTDDQATKLNTVGEAAAAIAAHLADRT